MDDRRQELNKINFPDQKFSNKNSQLKTNTNTQTALHKEND